LKRIDRLILRELVAPWAFGVALFTVILLAAGPLNKITSFLVGGSSGAEVLHLLSLMVPALLVKTFAMAMLLAGLLGFGRLSADSEIVALKAAGASVVRIVWPVFLAALAVSVFTFFFNDRVVPKAARAVLSLTTRLAQEGKIGGRSFSQPIVQKGKTTAMISAVNADLATQTVQNLSVLAYDEKGAPTFLLVAPNAHFRPGSPPDWKIDGPFDVIPIQHPRAVTHFTGGAWPTGIAKPTGSLEDLLIKKDDYDAYTIEELKTKIAQMKREGDTAERDIRDYEYGFYNKYSVAFAALVFGILGAALGITNRRSGSASGFALSVGIIFGYVFLANFMNEWARGGLLPPWAASFAPLCIGAVACGVIIYRRNA